MYKLLLCLRYLRTRWIALASIISVMLGVATMIVVNSVMAGFRHEMHQRLHGILSDVVVESHSLEGFTNVQWHLDEIRNVLGDELEEMSATVHVPAMLSFQFNGQWITRPVQLIGIDAATYANISDFDEYLLHEQNRRQVSFQLHESGYDARLPYAGWPYRRQRVKFEQAYHEQMEAMQQYEQPGPPDPFRRDAVRAAPAGDTANSEAVAEPPAVEELGPVPSSVPPEMEGLAAGDDRPAQFDEMNEQHTGIILGIAMCSMRRRNPDGNVEDFYLCLPGDDVKLTFPTAGAPPQAVNASFTVVDFYESKMSEYDSTLAFVPLGQLQRLRGMIDPQSGLGAVTSIQIKLKEGANLEAARDRLQARFPAADFPYRIQTWKEMQGPLLAAVQMETAILNILLFLIIAVAGFGILATFFMIVVEKTKDIGILKSLGAPSGGVAKIFLGYGLSLGIVGSGVGMVMGLLFVVYINQIAELLGAITGQDVFNPEIYYFQEIPTIVSPLTIAWIVVGAMLIAVLASVLPAIRAARLHPVEALRYE